jgi:hypothetical protein
MADTLALMKERVETLEQFIDCLTSRMTESAVEAAINEMGFTVEEVMQSGDEPDECDRQEPDARWSLRFPPSRGFDPERN